MVWQPGQSGNPKGKRPGTLSLAGKSRLAIGKAIPGILSTLIEQAKGGDVSASRLLLERVVPPLRATDQPGPAMALTSLADAPAVILAALSKGELTISQVAELAAAISGLSRAMETVELEMRIRNLEAKHGNA